MLTLLLLNWSSQSLGRNSERYTSYPQITDPYITRYFLSCHVLALLLTYLIMIYHIYIYLYPIEVFLPCGQLAMIASGRRDRPALCHLDSKLMARPFRQLELIGRKRFVIPSVKNFCTGCPKRGCSISLMNDSAEMNVG